MVGYPAQNVALLLFVTVTTGPKLKRSETASLGILHRRTCGDDLETVCVMTGCMCSGNVWYGALEMATSCVCHAKQSSDNLHNMYLLGSDRRINLCKLVGRLNRLCSR